MIFVLMPQDGFHTTDRLFEMYHGDCVVQRCFIQTSMTLWHTKKERNKTTIEPVYTSSADNFFFYSYTQTMRHTRHLSNVQCKCVYSSAGGTRCVSAFTLDSIVATWLTSCIRVKKRVCIYLVQ